MTRAQAEAARLIAAVRKSGRALVVNPDGRVVIEPAAGLSADLIDRLRAAAPEIARKLRIEGVQPDRGPSWEEWILSRPASEFYEPPKDGFYRLSGWCKRCRRLVYFRRRVEDPTWNCEVCPPAAGQEAAA